MSITILPQSDTAWGNIAKSTGEGIGKGLEALANMKMQEYQNKQLIKQQNEQQEYNFQQQEKALEQANLGQFKPFVRVPGGMKLIQSLAQGGWDPNAGQPGTIGQTMGALNPPANDQQAQVPGTGLAAPKPANITGVLTPTSDPIEALKNSRFNTPEIISREKLADKKIAAEDARTDKKLAARKGEHETEEKKQLRAEATPFIKAVEGEHKAWMQRKAELERIGKLSKGGNVQDPKLAALMKRFGLNVGGLMSADSAEIQKLVMSQLKGVREISPRATNFDVQAYEKTLPDLLATPEGRERVIYDLLQMGDFMDNYYKIAHQRLKDSNYEPPAFFESRVADDVDKFFPEFLKTFEAGAPKYKVGESISEASYKDLPIGAISENPATGKDEEWNGRDWVPVKGK